MKLTHCGYFRSIKRNRIFKNGKRRYDTHLGRRILKSHSIDADRLLPKILILFTWFVRVHSKIAIAENQKLLCSQLLNFQCTVDFFQCLNWKSICLYCLRFANTCLWMYKVQIIFTNWLESIKRKILYTKTKRFTFVQEIWPCAKSKVPIRGFNLIYWWKSFLSPCFLKQLYREIFSHMPNLQG